MYKKAKKIVKLSLIFVLSTIVFTIVSLVPKYINYDNIWNFHFIQKIVDGYIPYKDFNIIIPPLFHYTGALFVKIFGDRLYVMDIYGGVINAILLILSSTYINSVVKETNTRIVCNSIIMAVLLLLNIGANYNLLILIPILSILLLEKNFSTENNKKIHIKIAEGLLLGTIILIKHSIGLIFNIAFYIYLIITLPKEKRNIMLMATLLPEASLGVMFIIFLCIEGNLAEMFNYCIGGISEFGNENFAFSPEVLSVLFFIIVLSLPSIVNYNKYKENYHLLQLFFTISSFFITYPLMNTYHIWTALYVPILSTLTSWYLFFSDTEFNNKARKIVNIGKLLAFLPLVIITITRIIPISYYEYSKTENEYPVFSYCGFATKEFLQSLKKVDEYTALKRGQGYEVYILSPEASVLGIINHVNNGDFDLLLYGNMGKDGVKKNIKRLSNIENPCFLKSELESICFQEPHEIEDYIVDNYNNIDKIEDFRVFSKY